MLTVLLPENEYSPALRALLTPLLPPGSVILDPDGGLDGLQGRRLLFAVALDEGGCNQSCGISAPRRWWAAWTRRRPSMPPSRSCWAA